MSDSGMKAVGLPSELAEAMHDAGFEIGEGATTPQPVMPEPQIVEKIVEVEVEKIVEKEVIVYRDFRVAPPIDEMFVEPPYWPRLMYACQHPRAHGASLFGPRGTGKTTAAHAAARAAGVEMVTYQASKGATVDDLTAFRDLRGGDTVCTDGPLAEAIRKDCWLLIEEANAMHPGVFSKLNTLTDGSGDKLYLPSGERLPVGSGFRVLLCFNPSYIGMGDINEALKDRLMPIYCDYMPAALETTMLIRRTGVDENTAASLVNLANSIRAAATTTAFDMSPRSLFRLLDMVASVGMTWTAGFETAILDLVGDPIEKGAQRETIRRIAETCGIAGWAKPKFDGDGPDADPDDSKNDDDAANA